MYKRQNLEKAYSPLPKYPATSRDIALVVDESMAVGDIEKVIASAGGKILKNIKLFDVYRGPQVGENKKSVAFALTYRHDDRTLTDEDVNKVHDKILKTLKAVSYTHLDVYKRQRLRYAARPPYSYLLPMSRGTISTITPRQWQTGEGLS